MHNSLFQKSDEGFELYCVGVFSFIYCYCKDWIKFQSCFRHHHIVIYPSLNRNYIHIMSNMQTRPHIGLFKMKIASNCFIRAKLKLIKTTVAWGWNVYLIRDIFHSSSECDVIDEHVWQWERSHMPEETGWPDQSSANRQTILKAGSWHQTAIWKLMESCSLDGCLLSSHVHRAGDPKWSSPAKLRSSTNLNCVSALYLYLWATAPHETMHDISNEIIRYMMLLWWLHANLIDNRLLFLNLHGKWYDANEGKLLFLNVHYITNHGYKTCLITNKTLFDSKQVDLLLPQAVLRHIFVSEPHGGLFCNSLLNNKGGSDFFKLRLSSWIRNTYNAKQPKGGHKQSLTIC